MNIPISVDPGNASSVITKVENDLAKLEARGPKVGPAISKGMKEAATSAEQARNAFAPLTAVFEREAVMLDRIHGPMKRLEQDLQSLESLYRKGLISAQEYTAQLQKMGAVHGPSKDMAGPADGGLADHLGDKIAGIAGPAALAATAISSITEAIGNWSARIKDVDNATNAILKFHDSIGEASAAMDEQKALSGDLGLNIGKTARAYADTREGLDSLGLSSKQYADITRQVTAAVIVDGGAIEDVSGIMAKLQYVNEAGILTQGDLHKLYKQSPEIVKSFAASLGVSVNQLIEMAKQGKLTGGTLEKMETGLGKGTAATDKYAQRIQTLSSIMEENHVGMNDAIMIGAKVMEGYKDTDSELTKLIQKTDEYGLSLQHTAKAGTELIDKLKEITSVGTLQAFQTGVQEMVTAGFKIQGILDQQGNRYQQFADKIDDYRKAAKRAGENDAQIAADIAKIHGPDWVDYYLQQLDAIRKPQQDWAGQIAALDSLLKGHTISVEEYGAALSKVTGHTREVGEGMPRNYAFTSEVNDVTKFGGPQAGEAAGLTGPEAYTSALREKFTAPISAAQHLTEMWMKQLDAMHNKTAKVTEDMAKGFGDIAGSIGDMALSGDKSVKQMVSSMISQFLTLMVSKGVEGIAGLFGGGVAGAASSALTGGLPGFASGGMILPGHGGGTDSQIVAFRKSPDEAVRIHTPEQERAFSQGGKGGGGDTHHMTFVLPEHDFTTQVESQNGAQAIIRVISRAFPHLRKPQSGF